MSTQPEPTKRLVRSESNRMLAGVCGGLGEFFGIDATIIRIVFVVLAFMSGAGIIAYLVMWLIVPTASKVSTPPRDVPKEGFGEMREGVERGAREAKERYERWRGQGEGDQPPASQAPTGPPPAPTGPPPAPPSQTAPGGPAAPPSGATPGGPPPAPPADAPGGPPPTEPLPEAPPEAGPGGDEEPPRP
jgi:phage shock protein C